MQASERAIAKLKELEGFSDRPYECSAGKRTIGYGHVIHDGDAPIHVPVSEAEASAVLAHDVASAEATVNTLVRVPLTQSQFDALILFAFNIGGSAFEESTMLRLLNDGGYRYVPEEIVRWHFVHGRSSKGLLKRRLAEVALWNSEEKS